MYICIYIYRCIDVYIYIYVRNYGADGLSWSDRHSTQRHAGICIYIYIYYKYYIIVLNVDLYVYVYVYIDTDMTSYIYTCLWR